MPGDVVEGHREGASVEVVGGEAARLDEAADVRVEALRERAEGKAVVRAPGQMHAQREARRRWWEITCLRERVEGKAVGLPDSAGGAAVAQPPRDRRVAIGEVATSLGLGLG